MRPPFTCIERGIWDHDKFKPLSRIGKLVYFHVTTSSYGNGIGCFKAGIAAMAEDMGEPEKDFTEGFMEGLKAGCFKYDENTRVVLIPKYIHHNPPNNPNVLKGWGKLFLTIPDCQLKYECYSIIEEFSKSLSDAFHKAFLEAFRKPSESLPKGLPKESGKGQGIGKGIGKGQGRSEETSKSEYDDDFKMFWKQFPKKVGKKETYSEWKKAKKAGTLPPVDELVQIIENQKTWKKVREGYIKDPERWIKHERWNDEEPQEVRPTKFPQQGSIDFLRREMERANEND